ncbi:hypothetical protein K438DRAFT_2001910 [Mycena galopus ATCC 62051]|nr:hypothetical protein K438DRAFT_2001910 [Mycena galopus ATCC 62051]
MASVSCVLQSLTSLSYLFKRALALRWEGRRTRLGGSTSCYITTNTDYVPGLPPAGDELLLRQDMHWGPDDPTLWPHHYSETYCHLGASPDALDRTQTTSPSCGGIPVAAILATQALSPSPDARPLVPQLADNLRRGLDRLCSIPATFERDVLGVTNVQRTFLELYGLLDWITIYQPRMTDTSRFGGASDVDVVGVFTMDPLVAEQFHRARLPYWFIRPLSAFHEDNILRVWKDFRLSKEAPRSNSASKIFIEEPARCLGIKIFRIGHTAKAIEMPAAGPSRAPSAAGPSVVKSSIVGGKSSRQKPYDRPRPDHNRNQDAHFQQRNKFAHFDTPYMARHSVLESGACSCRHVSDTSLRPTPPKRLRLPEPALLIRDALLYRMGDVDEPHESMSAAEWRDALQGKLVVQGKHKSQAEKRTTSVEHILGPALRVCGINTLDGFPVAQVNVPPTMPARAKEITWELAEMNFRFELCALDEQACGVDRHEDCVACFPGGLLAPDLSESRKGFAAISLSDRLPHLLRLAQLMEDWTYRPRPDAVRLASERKPEYWNSTTITELEECVAGIILRRSTTSSGAPPSFLYGLSTRPLQ